MTDVTGPEQTMLDAFDSRCAQHDAREFSSRFG